MPAHTRPAYQLKIGQWIVNAEARRDTKGRIAIYKIPSGDGGGTFEVAGINDRYHPATAEHLRDLINLGQHTAAVEETHTFLLTSVCESIHSAHGQR